MTPWFSPMPACTAMIFIAHNGIRIDFAESHAQEVQNADVRARSSRTESTSGKSGRR